MAKVKKFDLLNSSLEGTNLIEASAGTGKTYTITGLFLRLILEKNFTVDEILVVTFTEAATGELRDRIRSKLRETIQAFSGGPCEDAFLSELVKKQGDSMASLKCLTEALRDFDKAAIFTIHGFCMKMLRENAFESGSLFDTELITNQESLKREIVEDFWRTHFYRESPLFVQYATDKHLSPEKLFNLLGNRVTQPYLKIVPEVLVPDASVYEREFVESFKEVHAAWPSARDQVEEILTTDKGLNRNIYREAIVPVWVKGLDDYLATERNIPTLSTGFEKFTPRELKRAVKKGHTPPVHSFFDLCENLKEKHQKLENIFARRLLGLKVKLFHTVQNELTRRKAEKNVQSFDDLLVKMQQALETRGGQELERAMGRKFRAALVDEFQDTDPVQYAVFNKVFGKERSILFLIGDPKQAVYGFRGADIFAYMEAAGQVKIRYTLEENWRSEPGLIAGINTMFSSAKVPFVYDEIHFQKASPAAAKDPEPLIIDGNTESPIQFWFVYPGEEETRGKTIKKGEARGQIAKSVAAEIAGLLDLGRKNRALLGKKALRESDMAVLVRKNLEARLMQEALSALGVPSVLFSTGNLFETPEAVETERILAAIAEPNNERLIKAALATDIIGVRGEELDLLKDDERGWEVWLLKFRQYNDLWAKYGFIRMFRSFVQNEGVLARLMSLPDGERRNTNVLHLSEVLHQISLEKKIAVAGLLKWLSEQREQEKREAEEHQLRLESDENAVKLVTIHKSKGLEYPVVFCPFIWDGSRITKKKDPFVFHDPGEHMKMTLDLGSEEIEKNRRHAEKELLAENLRLLYVALTRAKNRCYVVWGRFNEADTSAPAFLFHQPESWEPEDVVNATGKRFKGLSVEQIRMELKNILDKAGGTIKLNDMPDGQGVIYSPLPGEDVELECREFSGSIDSRWRISSFSALTSGRYYSEETPDRDSVVLPHSYDQRLSEGAMIDKEPPGIFSFPRGAKAGTFLHDIFEHLDFSQKEAPSTKKLVADKLKQYGFELEWHQILCDMIKKVLSAPLEVDRKDFYLSCIQNEYRLNEMEFYFPLQTISPEKLKNVFAVFIGRGVVEDFPELIEGLTFSPVQGFMKGFIDTVFQFEGRFYMVDWKSNFLGNSPDNYREEALALAMKEAFYILQYYIYTVALDQYLRLRLPGYRFETHFGGVYYIFIRGVDPDRGANYGIYRDTPSAELINALHENLIQRK